MCPNTISLRPFRPEDQDRILDVLTDNTVNRTYMLPDFATREDAIPLFQRLMALSRDSKRYVRCIAAKERVIGFLNDVEIKDDKIELGYVIHPEVQGQGYMTQALKMAIAELLASGYREVICGAFSENTASIRVMEKCGMTKLQQTDTIPYRGEDHICVYYAANKEN
ncbi:MAG: GNAT family N-acetyltransferase [Ruminococcaceae bacterium]|nr:GNAT family N-acetyltransferase [Oscillospiraceae bacterium]